jgi:hypothetical protein
MELGFFLPPPYRVSLIEYTMDPVAEWREGNNRREKKGHRYREIHARNVEV